MIPFSGESKYRFEAIIHHDERFIFPQTRQIVPGTLSACSQHRAQRHAQDELAVSALGAVCSASIALVV
jgi:hypothetical protein